MNRFEAIIIGTGQAGPDASLPKTSFVIENARTGKAEVY